VVSHCSNPDCLKPLHYLREGRIYVFDLPDPNVLSRTDGESVRRLEHFWLCGPCSEIFALEHIRGKGIRLIPKASGVLAS
jgi:hypothetical protein